MLEVVAEVNSVNNDSFALRNEVISSLKLPDVVFLSTTYSSVDNTCVNTNGLASDCSATKNGSELPRFV